MVKRSYILKNKPAALTFIIFSYKKTFFIRGLFLIDAIVANSKKLLNSGETFYYFDCSIVRIKRTLQIIV